MKKTGLFKIIMFVLLGVVACTWVFSSSYFSNGELAELGMYSVGFFDFFQLLFGAAEFQYFLQITILLLSIGALYGVLNKTGKYRAWIERIASFFKGAEIIFLFIVTFLIAALTSTFDYGLIMFIFFPLLISIILAMGYDKVTALVVTFGSTLVGTIGSTLGYNTTGIINGILSTTIKDGVYFKLAIFILSMCALFFFVFKAKRNKKDIKETLEDDRFIGEKITNKFSVAPIIIVFGLLFVLMILGCTNWEGTFNVTTFSDFNEKVSAFEVKMPYFHITSEGIEYGAQKTAIFGKILGTVAPFGEWYYSEMAVMCVLASLLIGILYRFKFKDTFSYMAYGIAKMIKPAGMVILTYCIVYFAGNTMFFPTIASYILGITSKFNLFFSTITMILGSALHVDMLYVANYVLPQLAGQDVNALIINLLAQGVYGATMFVAPTSIAVVLGLTYLNVSYKEWLKRIWKLALGLLAIVVVVIIVAMVI